MNQEYKECPGNLTISLREGSSMQNLLESLAADLEDKLQHRLNLSLLIDIA